MAVEYEKTAKKYVFYKKYLEFPEKYMGPLNSKKKNTTGKITVFVHFSLYIFK
jgi:hypothetical protein